MIVVKNYLSKVGLGEYKKGSLVIEKFPGKNNNWEIKINKKDYRDPDSHSEELYSDLYNYYNNKQLPNGNTIIAKSIKLRSKNEEPWWELVIDSVNEGNTIAKLGLGADYIGPSIYWACESGMNIEEIESFLQISRTFGGHIVWPRWIGLPQSGGEIEFVEGFISINTSRGGEKGFFDRIDLTLFDLKKWYLNQSCKLKKAYDKNKIWLEQFGDFNGFIDFFELKDYVCENGYRVKKHCSFNQGELFENLTSKYVYPATIPNDELLYTKLVDANIYLIKRRNIRLVR